MNTNKLQLLRLKEGMLQQELATKVGISNSYLSHIENGTRTISVDKYLTVLDFLGYKLMFIKKNLEDEACYKSIDDLNLKKLRLKSGLKQDYLAKKIGVSSSYISRLENKSIKQISLDKCIVLLDVLDYKLIPIKNNLEKRNKEMTSMVDAEILRELNEKEINNKILRIKEYKEYMQTKKELLDEIKVDLEDNELSSMLAILNSIEDDSYKEKPLFLEAYRRNFLENLKFLIDNDIEYTKKLDAEFYFILYKYKYLSTNQGKNIKTIIQSLKDNSIDGQIYDESLEESINRLGKPEYNSWSGAGCLEYKYLKDGTKVGVVHYLYSYYTTITRLNNISTEEFESSGYFNNEEYIILGEKEEPDDNTLGACEDIYDLFEEDVLQELIDTCKKAYHEGHLIDSRLWTYNIMFDYLIILIENNAFLF